MRKLTARELKQIELEIDLRLLGVWPAIDPEVVDAHIVAVMRACYAQGYTDALTEDERGERDKLMRQYGLRSHLPT